MPTAQFIDYVDQATEMGFRVIALTPLTGDVFMDKDLESNLLYLEENGNIDGIVFYTNFIGANERLIERLTALTKIVKMEISIYGHDLESFSAVTGMGETQYRRLLRNLSHLIDHIPASQLANALTMSISTHNSFTFPGRPPSDLCRLLQELVEFTGTSVSDRQDYDSWGGLITQDDIRDLDINLIAGRADYKSGPCQLLFSYIQIIADGRVNACACRDVSGSLVIGDLRQQKLREIISDRNPAYMRIIEDQQANRFQPSCRQCTVYKSIYDPRSMAQPFGKGLITREAFFEFLDHEGS